MDKKHIHLDLNINRTLAKSYDSQLSTYIELDLTQKIWLNLYKKLERLSRSVMEHK